MATNNEIRAPGLQLKAYPNAFPQTNILDEIRIEISDQVARIAHVEQTAVFDGLDRAAALDSGDLLIAVPRLRVKGISPKDLAVEIASKVNPEVSPALYAEAK